MSGRSRMPPGLPKRLVSCCRRRPPTRFKRRKSLQSPEVLGRVQTVHALLGSDKNFDYGAGHNEFAAFAAASGRSPMEKSERIAIAKEILDLIETGEPYMGDE